ncbi:hypothetical protein ACH5RR_005146 [Cinchona calisaya]|uniref:Protein SCAR n=1 Tax=Cinchona calisaya TaxID=153742 RepID=A0ABD3AKC7_9GENT
MPLSRYQIRNEYSLSDPDLFRAADKDDPEALLEGVAMAALVGVLRQLGDLAEFAAEIFHDLHDDVMATASRGHSMMVRVQQLEAEFPKIEKAFLSQTSHSSFFYNAGIAWHPNMLVDQNLITQGDLPRFIMDSYEECRGPPRLFLLDKFDVAGAGACLKRYTDPSIFKLETSYSRIASTDVLREKKTRKAKKKGSRWKNAETPETLPTSHAKLHQLFLEERNENGTSDSARRVKLKRRLNGFPFDSRSGKSYMEKIFKSPSPDHGEVHEIPVDSLPLALPYDSAFEIVEIGIVSPEKELKKRMRSPSASPTREGTILESAMDQLKVPSANRILEVSKSNPGLKTTDISPTLHEVASEKEIVVDEGIKTEGSVDDYQSDDIASEIGNYVDALTTMESEMDRNFELRSKNDLHYLNSRRQASDVDANGESVQAHSSDSLSTGNSTLSDDGNCLSKKDLSSFSYSDSHSIYAENTPSDGEVSSNVFTSTEIHGAEASLTQQSIEEEGEVSLPPEGTVSDGAFTEAVEIPSHSSELGDPTANSCPSYSTPVCQNEAIVVEEIVPLGPETGEMLANLAMDLPHVPSISDVWEQKGDSPKLSGDSRHLDQFEDEDINTTENLGCTSYLSVPSPSKDGFPLQMSAKNKFDAELQDEDVNQEEYIPSPYDCLIVPDTMAENPSLLSSENQPLDELHDKGPNWTDNLSSASNPSDAILHDRDDFLPIMSAENPPVNDFAFKDQNFLLDAPTCTSNIMEAATKKKLTENMADSVPQIGHEEDNLVKSSVENQISPQDFFIPLTEALSINPINAESETPNSNVEPFERFSEVSDSIPSTVERAQNVIFKGDTPILCESMDSFASGTTADIPTLGASKEQTSYLREEYLYEPSNVGDGAVVDKAASDPNLLERDTTPEASLIAGAHVHFGELDNLNFTHAVDGDGSSVDLKKLQGGSLSSVGNERNGLEKETCFLDRPGVSDVTEDGYNQKFASLDLNSLCNTIIDHDSGSQVLDNASETYVISGSGSSLILGNAPTCQSSVQHNKQELNHLEEKVDLLLKELDDKLLNGGEANSELSNQLQQSRHSNDDDQVGPFDASSESLLMKIPSQPSASELSPQCNDKIDVTEHLLDPRCSISSGFSLLPDLSRIYVEEIPPLPPLPPVQWRMGKLQHANPALASVSVNHNGTAFPPLLPSSANQEGQPLNPFSAQSAFAHDKSIPVSEQPICGSSPFLSQVPPMVHDADSKDNILPLQGIQSTRTFLQLRVSHGEMLQNDFQAGNGEKVQTSVDSFSNASAVDAASDDEEVVKPLNQMVPETSFKDMELVQCSAHSEENLETCDTTILSSKLANENSMPTSEEKLSWPTAEDSKLHGIRTAKMPRPRNPLVDAVVAHDKTKLRKVTERVRPQIQKEDERGSLLEQIRTKSFNLKPAVVTRPSIQGPKTNLKVAAILEKAKTIRQALAGSDEEGDDDSWSDS